MDPNQVVDDILVALNSDEYGARDPRRAREVISRANNLVSWLDKGGFIPDAIDELIAALSDAEYHYTAADLVDVVRERRGLPT